MNVLIPVKFLDHGSEFKKMRLLSHHCHKSQKKEKSSNTADKRQLCKVWFFLRERLVTMVTCTSIACGVPLLRWKLNTMPTPATKDLSVDIDHLFEYC